MARTPSTMIALGTPAPDFALTDLQTGHMITPATARGPKGLLVMFICRHCPYVVHVQEELVRIGNEYPARGIGVVAISSNNPVSHPDDAPDRLAEQARAAGFRFPYAHDASQAVAKAYTAACTPDFFLYDGGMKLVYRGQLDDSRPGNGRPVTGRDLRAALDALVEGRAVPSAQFPSLGCNIKWRAGNEPAYYAR